MFNLKSLTCVIYIAQGFMINLESFRCVIYIVQGFMFKHGKLQMCDMHCTGVHV